MKLIVIIISLISILLCVNPSDLNSNFSYIYILPILFFIFLICTFPLKKINKTYVYNIFLIQAIFRYCIIPIGISNGDYIGNGSLSANGNLSILFMFLELIAVGIFFIIENKKKHKSSNSNLKLISKNIWVYYLLFIMFIVVLFSGTFQKINPIWKLEDYITEVYVEQKDIETSSIGGLLFYPLKIGLLLLLTSIILESKYIKKSMKLFYILVLMGLSCSFIVGSSRFSIITFILPYYMIFSKIMDNKSKKIINVGLMTFLIPILLVTSMAKFTRGDNVATTDSIFKTSSLNAYFAGPGNVAIGIDSFEERVIKDNFLFFINDLTQNVPLLSKLTNDNYKSNFVYNHKITGHNLWQTQIVPLSIAGLYHFNVFGIIIYVVLFLKIATKFEELGNSNNYLPYKYIFYSLALTFSLVFMLNVGSIIATLVRTFIFIYGPFYLSNKLNKNKF